MLRRITNDECECAASEVGVLGYFHIKNEILMDIGTAECRPKPFRVGQYFDITIINSQSIYSHKYVV